MGRVKRSRLLAAGGVPLPAGPGSGGRLSLDCMLSQDSDYRRAPAPLDRAGLAEALRPFGESRMLPRAAYVDPAVFEWERRNFFGGGWMCVARSEQLPQPGDQRAEATGTGGVLLVRGEDGALHAFANTCRHRGHELLPCGDSSQARMIICPYHAWTYTLAGDLRAAGSFKKVRGFAGFVGSAGQARRDHRAVRAGAAGHGRAA